MGWVTLDDGQHLFIGSGGEVLATRAQISRASGGGANRVHEPGPGGMARTTSGLTSREKAAGPRQAPDRERTARIIAEARAGGPAAVAQSSKAVGMVGRPAPDRERTARIIAEARAGGPAAVSQRSKAVGMVGKPAAPSLREQAATARAGKGTREERIQTLQKRVETGRAQAQATIAEKTPKLQDALGKRLPEYKIAQNKGKATALSAVNRANVRDFALEQRSHQLARPAAPSLREQAATVSPHPSTFKGMSAPAGDAAGLARERGRIAAGVSAVRASATAAQSRERFARGEHDAAGVYREGAKIKVTGTRTITNPVTGKGKVTVPTGVVKIGDRTSKIGDQQAMRLAGKLPRASTNPGERSARALSAPGAACITQTRV